MKSRDSKVVAWQLLRRTLSTPNPPLHSILPLTRILLRYHMLPQIHSLHSFLLSLSPHLTCQYTIVKLLASHGHIHDAIFLFRSTRSHHPPPRLSLYNFLIYKSFKFNYSNFISWLYQDMISASVSPVTYTFNLLIHGLCNSDRLRDARHLFDLMPHKGCHPNHFTFGILIRAYCKFGLSLQGLKLLDTMKMMNVCPNIIIYNTLVASFCRKGDVDEAERLVQRMRDDGLLPDVVTFNSRISALCNSGILSERDARRSKDTDRIYEER